MQIEASSTSLSFKIERLSILQFFFFLYCLLFPPSAGREAMSSSSEFSHFSWQRSSPKSAEKPDFSPSGGAPSRYRKGKLAPGRDLNLGVSATRPRANGTPEMFHQPILGKVGNFSAGNLKSLDLFPQQAGFGRSHPDEVNSRACKSAMAGPQTTQMTIFYAGQVFVFNNFPADRAGEVMLLASRESAKKNPFSSNPAAGQSVFVPNLVGSPDSVSSSPPASTHISVFEEEKMIQDQTPQPITCGLPMARKASIQRFLEKRKDRLTARAPYQSCPLSAPSKLAGNNSWLGLAVQPQH